MMGRAESFVVLRRKPIAVSLSTILTVPFGIEHVDIGIRHFLLNNKHTLRNDAEA